jgi:hypothetical protein
MTQFNMHCKSVRFEFPPEFPPDETAKTNLLTKFSPEFVENVLSTLNRNEIRILNDSWEQLKTEAPRFAKLIPELPRLVHAYLQRDHSADRTELMRLLEAQRQTHQTLQAILLLALGFMAGIVITAMLGVWSLSN